MENLVENDICSVTEEDFLDEKDFYRSIEGVDVYAINDEDSGNDEEYFKSLCSLNGEEDIYAVVNSINEEDDIGCFIGCMLADTLQEVISSLVGGYAVLQVHVGNSANPDQKIIDMCKIRGEEIFTLRECYFERPGHKYSTIRRWISTYSEELIELRKLRKQHGC